MPQRGHKACTTKWEQAVPTSIGQFEVTQNFGYFWVVVAKCLQIVETSSSSTTQTLGDVGKPQNQQGALEVGANSVPLERTYCKESTMRPLKTRAKPITGHSSQTMRSVCVRVLEVREKATDFKVVNEIHTSRSRYSRHATSWQRIHRYPDVSAGCTYVKFPDACGPLSTHYNQCCLHSLFRRDLESSTLLGLDVSRLPN